jgi:hypothetical protein
MTPYKKLQKTTVAILDPDFSLPLMPHHFTDSSPKTMEELQTKVRLHALNTAIAEYVDWVIGEDTVTPDILEGLREGADHLAYYQAVYNNYLRAEQRTKAKEGR